MNFFTLHITIVVAIFFLFDFNNTYAQQDVLAINTNTANTSVKLGVNLEAPIQYKEAALKALSYYPNLNYVKIKFKEASIKTTLNARPALISLFKPRKNRTYIVRINNNYSLQGKITINEVPFEAQVGLIGHEFAHIDDYNKKNGWGIIMRGIAYCTQKSKARFEKEIDKNTIQVGLKDYLFSWSHFVIHSSDASKKYKEFKKRTYLTPEEIKAYSANK